MAAEDFGGRRSANPTAGEKPPFPAAVQPAVPSVTEKAPVKQKITAADDPFLSGFNADYKTEYATPFTETTNTFVQQNNRKKPELSTEQTLSQKGITPLHDDFLDGFNADDLAYLKRSAPRTSEYTGNWEEVQPDTAGSGLQIHARAKEPAPQTYEEYLASYEKTQAYLDELLQEMERYETESRDPHYMNSQWYKALDRERGYAQGQVTELLDDHPSLKLASEYWNKVNEDDFSGQFTANFDVGQLTELTNAAYNEYLNNPTEENKVYADDLAYLLKAYTENNEAALDNVGAVFPWLSKSAAGYLPQLGHQLEYGVGYGLVGGGTGAVAGSVIPGAGTAAGATTGFKSGYVAGTGKHSYDQLRGAAFRELLNAGMDEETARAAAEDEAFLSALIEMGGTALDIFSLGSGQLITKLAKGGVKALGSEVSESTWKKLFKALGKYVVFNIGGESAEEAAQQTVSIANRNRSGAGVGNLAEESLKTAWDVITRRNPDAAAEVWSAAEEGAKIAALFGGGLQMIDLAGQNAILRTSGKKLPDVTGSATVQSPVDRDIISTAQIWAQQFEDAIAKHLDEVQMVSADGTISLPSAANATQQNTGVKYTEDDSLRNHIETGESTTSRRRGVRGAHIKDAFMQNDILIVSSSPHSQIPGVEIITYRMPKRDKTGMPIPGEYQAGDPQRKTVYDPNVFSTSEYIRRGLEAANNAAQMFPDGILPGIWGGYDNDGVRWRGYYRDGKITSFYPE